MREKIYFSGGCFWGIEYHFQVLDGVVSTQVGYMGGTVENPTYEMVCSYSTGHAEVVMVEYDPKIVTEKELIKLFFEIHDPTQMNRQGPDMGDQYRSEIFYSRDHQKEIAQQLIQQLNEKGFVVATKLTQASNFYSAEEYHQRYYQKNGHTPYCHIRVSRFD